MYLYLYLLLLLFSICYNMMVYRQKAVQKVSNVESMFLKMQWSMVMRSFSNNINSDHRFIERLLLIVVSSWIEDNRGKKEAKSTTNTQ